MDLLHTLGIDLKSLLTQIVGFVLFLFILQRLLYKPIFGVIDKRQSEIEGTYDQLDRDRKAMEDTRREYEQRLAGIEAEAREKIQAAIKEAQELRGNIIADAHKQGETLLEKARVEAERERQRAFAEMRGQIVELAIGAAGRVVNDSLDSPRHQKLVDDYISSIGTTHAPKASVNGTGTAA